MPNPSIWRYPQTSKTQKVTVCSTTLDGVMAEFENHLHHNTLIKLDVQDFEDRVISGGRNTLKLAKFVIIEVNVDQPYRDQSGFRHLVDLSYDRKLWIEDLK